MSTNPTSNQCAYCGYEGGKHNDVCVAAENDRLREVIARCYMRLQCADVPREPWHWEVCTTLDNTGACSAVETSGDDNKPTALTPLEQLLADWWSTDMDDAELFNRAVRTSRALADAMQCLPEKATAEGVK